MRKLAVGEIAEATGGKLLSGDPSMTVERVCTDTRELEKGDLFIPLKGENFDGHRFVAEAVEKGARALLVDREGYGPFESVSVVKVQDTLEAFQHLAGWYRRQNRADFIAVTGSTGKTTTKDLIAAVLAKRYSIIKTPGNFNNQVGLPITVMQLDPVHDMAVVEMGMNSFGEIRNLVGIVKPRVSVITNIGMSHIEKLGSRENILKAKMEIFDGMAADPLAVLNGDDALLCEGGRSLDIPVIYYGIHNGDYIAGDIENRGERGTAFTVRTGTDSFRVEIPLPGMHNIYNSLAAVAVGRFFGVGFEDIISALKGVKGERMRLALLNLPGDIRVVDDVYNASPDSMKSALEVLGQLEGDRKIAVLADMLEMGDFSEKGHRFVGRLVARSGVDMLITVGDDSRYISDAAKEAGMDSASVYHFSDKDEAGRLLDCIVKEKDAILFKGSRGMKMETLVNRLQERS